MSGVRAWKRKDNRKGGTTKNFNEKKYKKGHEIEKKRTFVYL